MKTGMSEAEARETAEYDYAIEHGESTDFDLTNEQQKVAKQMTLTGTRKTKEKADYQWQKRERKPDNEKRDIIQKLKEYIANGFNTNAVINNPERQIDFAIGTNEYSITLTKHRPPKERSK